MLAVGFNRRFSPSIGNLRAHAQEGKLGVISSVHAEQTALAGLALTNASWRYNAEESPAAAMTGIGVHLVDGMIDCFGPVREVYCLTARRATAEIDDTTNIILNFENGVTGMVYCSIASTPHYRFAVHGTKGFAEVTGNNYEDFTIAVPQPGGGIKASTDVTPAFNTVTAELLAFVRAIEKNEPFLVPVDQAVHGVEVLEAVAESAKLGRPVKVGFNLKS